LTADSYTSEEVDAAVEALSDPDRFGHAQEIVTHAAPGLQRVLGSALEAGGWFDEAHETQLSQVSGIADPSERARAIHALVAEETRLAMLVGVSVGFELARELAAVRSSPTNDEGTGP